MKFLLTLFSILILVTAGHAQKLLATAKTDKQRILIGEPLTLTLEAIVAGNGKVSWPTIDTFPHFEVMKTSGVDTQLVNGGVLYRRTLIITSWDSGSWEIPPILIQGTRTLPITINVDHTPFDYNLPYNDVKTVIDVPKEKNVGWHWYLIGAVLLIMLFYLFFPDSRKEEVHYKGNPYEEAIQQLHNLKSSDAGADPKLYYTRLVQIFRDYVFRKKKLYSYSKTTDDLVRLMKGFDLPKELQSELTHTLMVTDMVKFAKYKPGSEENDRSLQTVKQSIITIENKK